MKDDPSRKTDTGNKQHPSPEGGGKVTCSEWVSLYLPGHPEGWACLQHHRTPPQSWCHQSPGAAPKWGRSPLPSVLFHMVPFPGQTHLSKDFLEGCDWCCSSPRCLRGMCCSTGCNSPWCFSQTAWSPAWAHQHPPLSAQRGCLHIQAPLHVVPARNRSSLCFLACWSLLQH